ncbi:hypothetical protein RvVAR0630_43470 [Agrobacterium vitis]|nr:hypothetical protein RvVAR0630_43470 [Agrobacterium vitis]
MISLGDACKNPDRSAQPVEKHGRRQASIFEGMPSCGQEQTLLRIGLDRFARSHAKEGGIEIRETVQKTAPACIAIAGMGTAWVSIEMRVDIPAVGGHFRNGIMSSQKILPEMLKIGRVGKLACHADDDNIIGIRTCRQDRFKADFGCITGGYLLSPIPRPALRCGRVGFAQPARHALHRAVFEHHSAR